MGKKSREKKARRNKKLKENKDKSNSIHDDKRLEGNEIGKNLNVLIPIILLAGLVVRIIYLFEYNSNPFSTSLVLDAANYDQYAQDIVSGKGFPEGVFTFNPFYSYLLSFFYWVFSHNLVLIRVVQIIIGTTTCYFIYLISTLMFGRYVGLIALGISALYGPFISFEGELVAATWVVAFLSFAIYLLAKMIHDTKCPNYSLILSGVALGLATLGRPNIIFFVPVAIASIAWTFRKKEKSFIIKKTIVMGLGFCLTISPITIRNYIQEGEFVLLSSHGGINFFIGNNKGASGWFKIPNFTGLDGGQKSLIESSTSIAEKQLGRKLKSSEVSDYWRNRGLKFIAKNPGKYLHLLIKKLAYSWSSYEKPNVSNYYFNKQYSFVLRFITIGFGIMGPLALIGMISAFPLRRRVAVLYLFSGVYLLSIVLFFISSRYRLPMIPVLIPFAAYASFLFCQMVINRQWMKVAMYGVSVLVLTILVNYPVQGKEDDMAHFYYLLGVKASDSGQNEEAIRYYEKASSVGKDAVFFNNLGVAYKNKGLYAQAVQAYRKGLTLYPKHEKAYLNLGVALRKLGKYEEAEEAYHMAIKIYPGYVKAHYNLGNLYIDMSRADEAIVSYKKAIELDPFFTGPYYRLARQYKAIGYFDEMAMTLERLISVTKGKVGSSAYRMLWEYYRDISPNPEKADYYKAEFNNK